MAAEFTVKTLDSGADDMMVFEPTLVKLAAGDSIRFASTDKGYNAELIKGMAPEGAATFKTVVGKEEVVTFDKPGVYGIKCAPHYIMGMIGLVVGGTSRRTSTPPRPSPTARSPRSGSSRCSRRCNRHARGPEVIVRLRQVR